MNDKDKEKIYNILKDIPLKTVDYSITEGTLVLEGGAFRGLYQEGVLDCLLDHGYNFKNEILLIIYYIILLIKILHKQNNIYIKKLNEFNHLAIFFIYLIHILIMSLQN